MLKHREKTIISTYNCLQVTTPQKMHILAAGWFKGLGEYSWKICSSQPKLGLDVNGKLMFVIYSFNCLVTEANYLSSINKP